eukprot:133568-Chlamydomonas_euryale.AAC.2
MARHVKPGGLRVGIEPRAEQPLLSIFGSGVRVGFGVEQGPGDAVELGWAAVVPLMAVRGGGHKGGGRCEAGDGPGRCRCGPCLPPTTTTKMPNRPPIRSLPPPRLPRGLSCLFLERFFFAPCCAPLWAATSAARCSLSSSASKRSSS